MKSFRLFGKAPEIEVLEIIEEHLKLCCESTETLLEAVKIKLSGSEPDDLLNKVVLTERRADDVRREIVSKLAEGVLPPMSKEDLMHLVLKQDKVADWTKESGDFLRLINIGNLTEQLKEALIELVVRNTETNTALQEVLAYLYEDWEKAVEKCQVVEDKETKVDLQYFKFLELLFKSGLENKKIILLNELARNLEKISDNAEDTSDLMKVVSISTFS
jgi:predicted phosphate transport protein (TIGR00153 family)